MSQPMKVALMKPTFVPNRDTQMLWSAISSQEVAAGGPYTAGGLTLASKSTNYDAPNDRTNLVAADTIIGPGLTVDTAFAVVYDSSTGALWSLVDFEGTKSISSG